MTMASAPRTSAHASASDRKTCCAPARRSTECPARRRAARSFGIAPSPTSAEPPNAARSTSSSTCRATPSAARDVARRLDLARVDLPVADRQRVELEAVARAPSRRRCRSRARRSAGADCLRLHRTPHALSHAPASAPQMYLCTCSCSRTGRRSSRIHSASCLRLEHAVHRREQHRGAARPTSVVARRRRRARTRSRRDPG